jgi:hypothetical protein
MVLKPASLIINNLGAESRGCCSHKVFIFGFHTFMTAAEPQGMKPSIRINNLGAEPGVVVLIRYLYSGFIPL